MNSAKPEQELTSPESRDESPATPVSIKIRRLEKLETTLLSQGASN